MDSPKPITDTIEVSPQQIRAARALLDWTMEEAAQRMSLARETLHRLETGKRMPGARTLRDIVQAFSDAGVTFVNEDGARGVIIKDGPQSSGEDTESGLE